MPLALLSSAVTVHLAAPGANPVSAAPARPPAAEPATPFLTAPPMTPASVSTRQATEASATGVVPASATGDVAGIPAPALAAYQRAETVINAADPSCGLSWQMLAAIGHVESDHGRFGVSQLDGEGLATPAIIGLPLDGTNGTAEILDTDAGVLDGDQRFDRAVGPMQFIPSTWSVVGVDADDDGERNPQDIDDAALAAAVYLCSGDDDLATPSGQAVAVSRYNHSAAYVERVLTLMQQYLAGGFGAVPAGAPQPLVKPTTVAAGRIDELHPEDGRPEGGFDPSVRPPAAPTAPARPPRPDVDIDPAPQPEPEPPAPTVPPVMVLALPPAPGIDDPCGAGNATWLVPASTKQVVWTFPGKNAVVTLKGRATFPDGTTSHDYGSPVETNVEECPPPPRIIPAVEDGGVWPSTGLVPAKPELKATLTLADAVLRCEEEGFLGDTFERATCVAYYADPAAGGPKPGDTWAPPAS